MPYIYLLKSASDVNNMILIPKLCKIFHTYQQKQQPQKLHNTYCAETVYTARVINKTFYLAKKKGSSKVTEGGYFHSLYFYLLRYFQVFANLMTKNLHITFYDLNKQFNHPNQGWMQGKYDVKINICRNLDAITTTSGEFLGASPLHLPSHGPNVKSLLYVIMANIRDM